MRFSTIFIIVILTLLVLYSTDVCAKKKHRIGFERGLTDYTNRDDLVSPLLYKGHQKTYGFSYTYKGIKNWHSARVNILIGDGDIYLLSQYGYVRLVSYVSHLKMGFWLGGSLESLISSKEYLYRRSWSAPEVQESISTLNINHYCELLSLPKQRVVVSVSIPILARLKRKGYSIISPDSPIRLTSINGYQRFRFSTVYERTLFSHFMFHFKYWFTYSRFSQPRKTISVFHGFSVGMFFQI